jgi:endonuclease/exonuclease/phosphatase family metal-dependent hydrolase
MMTAPRIVARPASLVEATAIFWFFFQALRVLFSTLFGVIYDALFAEIVPLSTVGILLILVVLALLTPLATPRKAKTRQISLLAAAVLIFLARIPLILNEPQMRLAVSIIVVAATGLYLSIRTRQGAQGLVPALILALVVDQLFRAAGHTFDVTLRTEWWPGQAAVSAILCLLAGWLYHRRSMPEKGDGGSPGILAGLAWGGWLFLEVSLLAFPNAIGRWSELPQASYWLVAALLLAVTLLPLLMRLPRFPLPLWLGGTANLAILLLCLIVGSLMDGAIVLLLMLLAQFIILRMLFPILAPELGERDRLPGLGLALGGILFLVLSFAYAFTFTYPYTLEMFRDMGLVIILIGGLLASLPSLRRPAPATLPPRLGRTHHTAAWGASALLVLSVVALAWPRAFLQPAASTTFRAVTYNIHYGYDTYWHVSLEEQARTIEASGAGVVAMQEVDTGRPTSYMIDDALWLANRLGMEVVYLPTLEHLSGIALLSRYPVIDWELLLLPSELEQTGIIWAKLDVGGTPINAFAIWMGLEPEERALQLDAALPFIAAHPGPAVFGGDFNSQPGSLVYDRIASAGFVDPFVALGLGSPPTDPAINPTKRIDFVWLRDLVPVHAQVVDSTASDHRPVVVKATWP